jgi:hypothetical protein
MSTLEKTANMSYNSIARENLLSSLTKAVVLLRSRLRLLLIGIISEFLYFFYLLYNFPLMRYFQKRIFIENITKFSRVSFFTFLIAFSILFILFGLAWWEAHKFRDQATLWIILGFGGIFALTTIFVYPLTSPDIFTYIVRSLVMMQYHTNPITTPPVQFAKDPLMHMAGANITLSSPYGPLCVFIQALPVVIAGRNLLASLLLTKIMFSTTFIASAFFVYKILSQIAPRFALSGTLALAWNPFTLFEYSVNSHNDIAMMFFVILAVFALLKERPVWAMTLITASALIKFASIVLIPLFFIYSFSHQSTLQKRILYIIDASIISLALIINSFAPFWIGPQTFGRFFEQIKNQRYSFSAFLYYSSSGSISSNQANMIGWTFFGACFLYSLWLSSKDFSSLLKGCCITMFAFLGLSATYNQVWYLIWPFALAVLVPQTWIGLATIFPLYVATVEQPIDGYIVGWGVHRSFTVATVNIIVYLAIFFPPVLFLSVSRFRQIFLQLTSCSYSDIKTGFFLSRMRPVAVRHQQESIKAILPQSTKYQ